MRAHLADWENLRFFVEARRAGSLTKAARRLGVDHTTVSRRIAALEAALGVRLFDRSPTGYAATAAAEELLLRVERIEQEILEIERGAATCDPHVGVVKLATTSQLAADFVIPALPRLAELHPGITVEITADNRHADLVRREADLALRIGRPRDAGMVTRKLADIAYAFYARREGRSDRALRVERDAFVGYDESLHGFTHEIWLDEAFPTRRTTFRANNLLSLQTAARHGLGVALLPCFVGDGDPALVRLAAAEKPLPQELWLVVHGELRRSARVRAVLDALVERATAMAQRLSG